LIFAGCKYPDAKIGVYAGSEESYSNFSEFMDKVIDGCHHFSKESKHITDINISKINWSLTEEE
jgi:hypothetical protein